MNTKTYTIAESEEQYTRAKESVGIAHDPAAFFLVSGENALSILDRCSV